MAEYYSNKSACKTCKNIYTRFMYKSNPDMAKNQKLKRKYNINLKDYNNMFEVQKGCCKICLRHVTKTKRLRLCVDHCHGTKKVRGLLCDECNVSLGNVRDDVIVLKRMIEYLDGV